MASLNKNTFCGVRRLAPFCIETNPRENRFFAACGRLVDKKGAHNVKNQAENYTKQRCKQLFCWWGFGVQTDWGRNGYWWRNG